jgi:hypothetical protein
MFRSKVAAAALALLLCASTAHAQLTLTGAGKNPGGGGGGPTPAYKWITGSGYLCYGAGTGTCVSVNYAQGSNTIAAGDSLFVVIHGFDSSGMAAHISTADCPTSPAFSAVYYAPPDANTSSSTLVCYRRATGTEPTTFSSPTWSTDFLRGLTGAYIDFSNGSSVSSLGSNTYQPFDTNSIASGQVTGAAGNVLIQIIGNFHDGMGYNITPASGSMTATYDASVSGCSNCGNVNIQATTLASSGTTAVMNYTSSGAGADYGNIITFQIVP